MHTYAAAVITQISFGVTLFLVIRSLLSKGDRRGWWLVAAMMR